jgi:hypothetical protein
VVAALRQRRAALDPAGKLGLGPLDRLPGARHGVEDGSESSRPSKAVARRHLAVVMVHEGPVHECMGNGMFQAGKLVPTAIVLRAALLASPVAATSMEQATANLRSCLQQAVVSIDDKVSDIRIFVGALISDCNPQVEAFVANFEFRGYAREPLINMAMRAITENRAPKWWQFWR